MTSTGDTSSATHHHLEAFCAWEAYSHADRLDIGLTAASILRRSWPGCHVVRVDPDNCDLAGFAAAGHATWTAAAYDDGTDGGRDARRAFAAPGARSDKHPGQLADRVTFGRAAYAWEGREFVVYEAEYAESPFRPPTRVLFVLAPATEGRVAGGHHEDIDALLLACGRWTKELHEEIFVFDRSFWHKDPDLYESVQSATWDDVILDPETKAKLIDDVQGFFDNQALYESFQVPWKRGVILHGVPGNGKTISIKALINTLSKRQPEPIPSLYVKSLDSCNGEKWCIQNIFAKAREMAPCVLIFEDLDSMVTDEIRSYFLNEVDGLDANDGILMIGSTNHLDRLDPAIAKRPSRFDRKYHFRLPNAQDRALYCRYWAQKLAGHPLVAFPEELCPVVAGLTEGFSFAYLKELFVASLLLLARGGPHEDVGAPKSDSGSSTDAVVIEPDEAAAGAIANTTAAGDASEDGAGQKDEKRTNEKTLPKVEVPESLQGNTLLGIITAQAQSLLDEMDNTDDGPTTTTQIGRACPRMPTITQQQMAMRPR